MQNLVAIESPNVELVNGQAVVLSHVIAKHFGKPHKNVLRDIKELECSSEFNRLNFEPVSYLDAKGEQRPSFNITRDGFTFLVMGWQGPKAAAFKEAYIAAFNRYEAASKLLPDESRVKTRELATMERYASELLKMQRRCIRLQTSVARLNRQKQRLLEQAQ